MTCVCAHICVYVHKKHLSILCVKSYIQVFDEKYFLVEMDDLRLENRAQRSFVCHTDSPGIFPVQWSLKNGLHISPPPGVYSFFSHLFAWEWDLSWDLSGGFTWIFCPHLSSHPVQSLVVWGHKTSINKDLDSSFYIFKCYKLSLCCCAMLSRSVLSDSLQAYGL